MKTLRVLEFENDRDASQFDDFVDEWGVALVSFQGDNVSVKIIEAVPE